MRVIAHDKASTRRLTTAILHGTSPRGEQGSADAVAEVQMEKSTKMIERLGQKFRNRRANMAASWRQRNLRSRWIGVILGLQTIGTPRGVSQSVKSSCSVKWTYDRERFIRVWCERTVGGAWLRMSHSCPNRQTDIMREDNRHNFSGEELFQIWIKRYEGKLFFFFFVDTVSLTET